jgi:hypothetical protein
VRSCFDEFIETNLTVQLEFNLIFWFVSYNVFFTRKNGTHSCHLSPPSSAQLSSLSLIGPLSFTVPPLLAPQIPDRVAPFYLALVLPEAAAALLVRYPIYWIGIPDPVQTA